MSKLKQVLQYLVISGGFVGFIYYCAKFITEKHLYMNETNSTTYSIIFTLIFLSFIVGVFNLRRVAKLEKKNKELKQLILTCIERNEENFHEILCVLKDQNEISLDTFSELDSFKGGN